MDAEQPTGKKLPRTTWSVPGKSRGEGNSTDQIPRRAVQSGDISQLGYIDPDLGGNTDRYELSGSITGDKWHWTAYVVDYDFNLFSNFTYNLENPIQGDEFEQVDDRTIFGTRVDCGQSQFVGVKGIGLYRDDAFLVQKR